MKWNNRKGNFSQKPQRENHAKERKEGLDHATRNESTLCG